MASSSHRLKVFPAPARFFKVIMDSKSDTSLLIPPEFTRRYGHYLPNRIFLKLPNGKKSTEVELIQVNGQTSMQTGWPEFKRRLSLGFGHFLVFEYDGDSLFNVLVFDTSAVEINYLLQSDRTRKAKAEIQEIDVTEISDDYPVKKSLKTTKSPKIDLTVGCRVKRDESTDCDYDDCSVTGTGRQFRRGAASKETSAAYQKAVAFAARLNPHKTPFHIRLMQKSYVSCRFSLCLPLSFAGLSLPCTRANSVTMVTDGKKWSVRCLVRNRRVDASTGWRGFVMDNGLKVGDVCIFEVASKSNKEEQPVWNVVIFRG